MSYISHSPSEYSTLSWFESRVFPQVRYAIRRISLAQRIELTARARDLTQKYEFLKAGDSADQLEASLADLLTRRLYVEWGLVELRNLSIDGEPAGTEDLIEKGPEPLLNEIVAAIHSEIGLSEEERKNS